MTTRTSDNYISDVSSNYFFAWLKSIAIPFMLLWWLLKFLVNPKKSKVKVLKQVIIFPFLDFFTHENGSDKVLKDYSYFHQKILNQETFDENIKINFESHKAILLNSKIAKVLTLALILLMYFIGFLLSAVVTVIAVTISAFFPPLLAIITPALFIAKVVFGISGFAIFWAMLKEILITDKKDIKEYIDEIIFYADLKNREIFGEEHAQKVKDAIYEAYLPNKLEVVIPSQFVQFYQIPQPEPVAVAEKKEQELKKLNEYVGV